MLRIIVHTSHVALYTLHLTLDTSQFMRPFIPPLPSTQQLQCRPQMRHEPLQMHLMHKRHTISKLSKRTHRSHASVDCLLSAITRLL